MERLLELFMDGLRRFDAAMADLLTRVWSALLFVARMIGGLFGIMILVLVAALVLLIAWTATGLMERLQRALWQKGIVGRLVYILVIVPIYILIVIRTEVGLYLAFLPTINVWIAIVAVGLINVVAIAWHARHARMWPAWVYRGYRRVRPLPPPPPPMPNATLKADAGFHYSWNLDTGARMNQMAPGARVCISGRRGDSLQISPTEWVWEGIVDLDHGVVIP